MRIVTWNVNSIRLRISLIKRLNDEECPDIVCLQETKAEDQNFPVDVIKSMGFTHIISYGQKAYNGVAILSKIPIQDCFSLDFCNEDRRHICAKINNLEIHNFYVPAGGDEPDVITNPKYRHKIEYIKSMHRWFVEHRKLSDNIILVGDFNIAPHENDVWSSRQLDNVVSHTTIERTLLCDFQESCDFIDTARYFTHIDKKLYSWWSYRNRDWKKSNRGRRLDHIWTSHTLKKYLQSIKILSHVRDWQRPSDHVPCILDIY